MKTTLVIMAAGIGSRFGTGIKQLAKMNDAGEIIMDYSIYDAKEAGFNKVVFIIRHDIEAEFKEVIGNRISQHIEVAYVYQELDYVALMSSKNLLSLSMLTTIMAKKLLSNYTISLLHTITPKKNKPWLWQDFY